ncbi:MAG TPA: substrate-binding and VWA domain-containing protein [Ktedonobacteraceae bacterium]|nr:substrate-binding and VWA domain-containing protein [Ktedonobacteraceae bacterium]
MMYLKSPDRRRRLFASAWSVLCLAALLMLGGCANPLASANPGATATVPATDASSSYNCTAHSAAPVNLTMYYDAEKQTWMNDVVNAFNKQQISACDGPITVQATPYTSGQSLQAILKGGQVDIWSPASSAWLSVLNQQWQEKHGSPILGGDNPALVKTPVVIAMWQPMAQALGWPGRALGWSDIASLSLNPKGWAAYGHPEWGSFKFGHTNPDGSNSGLAAVLAEDYTGANKQDGLTGSDIASSAASQFVTAVESSIIHYGEDVNLFATEMFSKGPAYLSAAVMNENMVIGANRGVFGKLTMPVVAIYPKEGTFYSDNPFAVLHADWVTPAKQAAAQAFRAYLLASTQQQKAQLSGLRPAVGTINPAVISTSYGVDPTQPKTVLQVPDASVILAAAAAWTEQRRKVDVMLIIDHSGSMDERIAGVTKIVAARQGMVGFVTVMSDLDRVGLTQFNGAEEVLSSISDVGPKRQRILQQINGIKASGHTLLFDTVADQFRKLKALSTKNIKALVVLTDGKDDVSKTTLAQLLKEIAPTGVDAGEAVKIFTIAYGDIQGTGVDVKALTQIATATGAQEYAGTPQNIQQIYDDISKFF